MGTDKELAESVNLLKKKRNAIILAHVYQPAEVQDIADYVGDSLDLSRKAVKTNADVYFFCGVQFMAKPPLSSIPAKRCCYPTDMQAVVWPNMATAQQVNEIKKRILSLKLLAT